MANNTKWVVVPRKYIKDINKGQNRKDGLIVNVPSLDRNENIGFKVMGVKNHPQIKDYCLVPIGYPYVDCIKSHLENGKYVKDGFVKYSQEDMKNMILNYFSVYNDENNKYVTFEKTNFIDRDNNIRVLMPSYLDGSIYENKYLTLPKSDVYESAKSDELLTFLMFKNTDYKFFNENGESIIALSDDFIKTNTSMYNQYKKEMSIKEVDENEIIEQLKKYNSQVDNSNYKDLLNKNIKVFEKMPFSLVFCGFNENSSLEISYKNLNNILNDTFKDINREQIFSIINSINDPVCVLKGSNDDSFVLVSDVEINGKNVVIPIVKDTNSDTYNIDKIKSFYPKDNIEFYIEKEMIKDNLLSYNTKKIERFSNVYNRLLLPKTLTSLTENNISQNENFVNIYPNENNEKSVNINKEIEELKDKYEIGEVFNENKELTRFKNEIDFYLLEENFDSINDIKVCDTPKILLDAGFEQKPILYSSSHLRNAIKPFDREKHQHGIALEDIYKLPKYIEEPAIILKNYKDESKPILVFDAINTEEAPLFAVLNSNGKGYYELEEIDSNFVLSLYGKDKFNEYLEKAAENNEIVYYNNKKVQHLEVLTRLSLSSCASKYEPCVILQQINDNVNSENLNESFENVISESAIDNLLNNLVGKVDEIKEEIKEKTSEDVKEIVNNTIENDNKNSVSASDLIKNNEKNVKRETNKKTDNSEIKDFGKKIGGAKKDLWKEKGLTIDDISDMNVLEKVKHVTKQNVWIKMDYKDLVSKGLSRDVAYFLKNVYDALPVKPLITSRTDENSINDEVIKYINFINIIKKEVLSYTSFSDCKKFSEFFREMFLKNSYSIKDEWCNINVNKVYKVGSYYSFYEKSHFDREMDKKNFCLSENEILENKFNEKYKYIALDNINGKIIKEDTYYRIAYRDLDKGFSGSITIDEEIYNKIKDAKYVAFDRDEWLFYSDDDLEKLKEKVKNNFYNEIESINNLNGKKKKGKFVYEGLSDFERIGEEYRMQDAKGEDFLNDFNFYGGEFGNWENQKERQENLNKAYDGFCDLAKALNISLKDVTLDGKLSIAFGARGSGSALAHYEGLRKVINLTKMKGAGSLAHEYGHFLDNLLQDYVSNKQNAFIHFGSELDKSIVEKFPKYKELVDCLMYKKPNEEECVKYRDEKALSYKKDALKFFKKEENELYKDLDNIFNSCLDNNKNFSEINASFVSFYNKCKNIYKDDNYDKKSDDYKNAYFVVCNKNYIFYNLKFYREEIQPKTLEEYYKNLKLNTDFYNDSNIFDTKYSKEKNGYWTSNEEMFARAFACYIEDKLSSMGIKNNYLCGHASRCFVYSKELERNVNAYPVGEERKLINQKFDELFTQIKENSNFFKNEYEEKKYSAMDLKEKYSNIENNDIKNFQDNQNVSKNYKKLCSR